jgi:hypothetical protein
VGSDGPGARAALATAVGPALPEVSSAATPGFAAAIPPGGGADPGDFVSTGALASAAGKPARGVVVAAGAAVSTGVSVVTRVAGAARGGADALDVSLAGEPTGTRGSGIAADG